MGQTKVTNGPSFKVLIDEGLAVRGQMSGMGTYMANLVLHLKKFIDCDITRYPVLHRIPRYIRKWSYIATCNLPRYYEQYDLVHHMANYVPLVKGKNKHVMTVHDLSIFHYPETVSIAWRHFNAYSFRKSVERADALIAISKSIRQEVLAAFPQLDSRRVFVCYPGVRASILRSQPDEREVVGSGIEPYTYFLFIGDLTKRKNLGFAIEAFLNAKRRNLIDKQTGFLIIGKKAWGYSEIKRLIMSDPSVQTLGYLPDEKIAALYRFAKAFIYPSIYEGFGAPIVEAMSQDVPIILSRIPTSVELNVAHNNQMLFFDLGDQEGLIRVLENANRDHQAIRSRLNYGDLSEYDYDTVAKHHCEIYKSVLGQGGCVLEMDGR